MRDRDPGTAAPPKPAEFSAPAQRLVVPAQRIVVPTQRRPSDPYTAVSVRRQLRPAFVVTAMLLVATLAATGTVLVQSSRGTPRSGAAAAVVPAAAREPQTPYEKI